MRPSTCAFAVLSAALAGLAVSAVIVRWECPAIADRTLGDVGAYVLLDAMIAERRACHAIAADRPWTICGAR